MTSLIRLLAIALLAGTACLGVGAAVHPMLPMDAVGQLRTIADTPSWRTIHLVMLAGSALVIAGVWVRLLVDRSGAPAAVVAALAAISVGLAINALNIAFMAAAGWRMAALYQGGDGAVALMFDVTHPIGLMAARFGNLVVALGALALGWAEWHDASRPRLLALLAWAAAAGGLVGVLFFDESSRLALAAVALLSGWQVVTGVGALVQRRTA